MPEENIVLGYGCEDLLKQCVHHFVKKGEGVLVAQFSWWYFKKISGEVEGVTYEFPVHRNDTRFQVDIRDILTLQDQHHPKLILLANPNNPTGDAIMVEDLEILIRRCPDTLIVLDESYWGYNGMGNSHLKRFLENHPNVLILRTFSKFFGLAGVRIGYGFIHQKHEFLIRSANRYLGFNRLAEEIALAALDSFDHYLEISRVIEAEKQRYYKELRPLQGMRIYDSQTNFVLMAVPEKTKENLKTHFEKAGILVRFFEEPGLENHFRVTIGKPAINTLVIQCIRDAVVSP